MNWVIEILWAESKFPHLVGPFTERGAAEDWGNRNIRDGEWNVAPLIEPGISIEIWQAAREETEA